LAQPKISGIVSITYYWLSEYPRCKSTGC